MMKWELWILPKQKEKRKKENFGLRTLMWFQGSCKFVMMSATFFWSWSVHVCSYIDPSTITFKKEKKDLSTIVNIIALRYIFFWVTWIALRYYSTLRLYHSGVSNSVLDIIKLSQHIKTEAESKIWFGRSRLNIL